MMIGDTIARDEAAMEALARRLASCLKVGDVLALKGELGAGKTTLARTLIRALAGRQIEVPSPTFTLLQTYDDVDQPVSHFDLYRLNKSEDIGELGWEEAISDSVVIVEWPERLPRLPESALQIEIDFVDPGRRLIFSGNEQWQTRLEAIL